MINAMQQETGADINVDDNGVIGTVTVGARDGAAVKEAIRRIELILDPPKAEVGATYRGKVVNITKFGAFVNILPGRDGLLHISKLSKLSQGKRVERVEDVLSLGEDLEVHVDDIDPDGQGVAFARRGRPRPSRPPTPRCTPRRRRRRGRWRRRRATVRDGLVRGHLGSKRPVRPSGTSARRRALDAPAGAGSSAAPPSRSGEARGQGPRRNPRRRH